MCNNNVITAKENDKSLFHVIVRITDTNGVAHGNSYKFRNHIAACLKCNIYTVCYIFCIAVNFTGDELPTWHHPTTAINIIKTPGNVSCGTTPWVSESKYIIIKQYESTV